MNARIGMLVALLLLASWMWLARSGASALTPETAVHELPAATQPAALRASLPDLPLDRVLTSQQEIRAAVAAERAATTADVDRLRATALHAPDPTVAGLAIRALGRLGQCASDPELLSLFDDPRSRVRQELVYALARSADPRADAVLARARASDDPALRALAMAAAPMR